MKKHSNYRVDIIPGIVIAVFAIAYMAMVPGIQTFVGIGSTPLTNHFVPYLWGGALLVLGLYVTVRGFRKRAAFIKAGGKLDPFDFKKGINDKAEVIASFVALTIYVALMNALGFVPMTIVYLIAQILILTPKHDWKKTIVPAIIVSVICSVFFFYIFRTKLNVLLPVGILSALGF